MKRFYTLVSTIKRDNGFAITLDGKAINTAMKAPLIAPNDAIANAIVKEWATQEEVIEPDTMPLTQILNTQIDRVGNERKAIQDLLLKYLDTDLLCYRADNPPQLVTEQSTSWDPYLDWFAKHFGQTLETTTALTALTQNPKAHDAVRAYVTALSDAHFTALQLISSHAGSITLGLACLEGQATHEEIFAAIRVEENFKAKIYNEEFYGPEPGQDKKDKAIKAELKATEEYLGLL